MTTHSLRNALKLLPVLAVTPSRPWRSLHHGRASPDRGVDHDAATQVADGEQFTGMRADPRTRVDCDFGMALEQVAERHGENALTTPHHSGPRSAGHRPGGAAAPVCRSWSDRQVRTLNATTRVLVVDDYEPAAEALATALVYEGFDTRFAFSGVEALGTIDVWVPHVIVLDINMPEHDGFETASIMRRLTATRHLGIIAFTALSDVEIEIRAHLCGFDAYCQKGSPLDRLVGLIDALVV